MRFNKVLNRLAGEWLNQQGFGIEENEKNIDTLILFFKDLTNDLSLKGAETSDVADIFYRYGSEEEMRKILRDGPDEKTIIRNINLYRAQIIARYKREKDEGLGDRDQGIDQTPVTRPQPLDEELWTVTAQSLGKDYKSLINVERLKKQKKKKLISEINRIIKGLEKSKISKINQDDLTEIMSVLLDKMAERIHLEGSKKDEVNHHIGALMIEMLKRSPKRSGLEYIDNLNGCLSKIQARFPSATAETAYQNRVILSKVLAYIALRLEGRARGFDYEKFESELAGLFQKVGLFRNAEGNWRLLIPLFPKYGSFDTVRQLISENKKRADLENALADYGKVLFFQYLCEEAGLISNEKDFEKYRPIISRIDDVDDFFAAFRHLITVDG